MFSRDDQEHFTASTRRPRLGGTAFGVTFAFSFGAGSLALGSMGLLGQRFGLPVGFPALGLVAAPGQEGLAGTGADGRVLTLGAGIAPAGALTSLVRGKPHGVNFK